MSFSMSHVRFIPSYSKTQCFPFFHLLADEFFKTNFLNEFLFSLKQNPSSKDEELSFMETNDLKIYQES